MNSGEIFKEDIVNIVDGVVSKATDTGGARLVAGHVFYVDVGRVAFDGYAILQCSCQDMLE